MASVKHIPGERQPDGWKAPDLWIVTGGLPEGKFEFERPVYGSPEREHRGGHYMFDGVAASRASFRLDQLSWYASKSVFRRCSFRQERRGPIGDHTGAQGLFGHRERCLYEDCLFDHIDWGQAGGGFSPGISRFERCTFRYCSWRWFFADEADFVECVFVGAMRRAMFLDSSSRNPDRRNEFRGNDFTRAKLHGVEFRDGIDLSDSRLPEGWTPSLPVD